MGTGALKLGAAFLAASLLAGCHSEEAAAKPDHLTQTEWESCLDRMNAAGMPAEEHCRVQTAPFNALSAPQQDFLKTYHLYYNCAEPLWEFNTKAAKTIAAGQKEPPPLPDIISEKTANGELIDADAYCGAIAGQTYAQIQTGSYRLMEELIASEQQEKGRALSDDEAAAFIMLFHRPYMPIEGFTQPEPPPMPAPSSR